MDKRKVLCVDDEAANIKIMSNMLRDEYEVFVSLSGSAALELAKMQHPDIILLDMLMPDMNGVEVCEALKADPDTADIPVFFVTSMDDMFNEAVGFKAGALDYVTKPVSPHVLAAIDNVEVDLWLLFFQQFSAFTGVGAVFAAKDHQ